MKNTKKMLRKQIRMELDYFHSQNKAEYYRKKLQDHAYLNDAVNSTADVLIEDTLRRNDG